MKKLLLLLLFIPLVFSCSSGSEEPPPTPIKYTLTTAANPTAGGAVTPASGQHNEDATVSITATPSGEYLFSSWSGATGTTATTSVVMNSNKTVTANFIKKKYALTTIVEGEGTVAEKVIKAGAATDYNSGTIVELTATPSDEWEFKEWTGDVTGAENPIEITIDKAKTTTAVFEEQSSSESTIWNGTTITFTKADGANPEEEANQDRITDNVWITRGNDGGQIYNIAKEDSPNQTNSPVGTKWAVGTLDQIETLTFKKFRAAVEKPNSSLVGKNLVMYLEEDDIYLSVKFTSWSEQKKGGFAYERSTKP